MNYIQTTFENDDLFLEFASILQNWSVYIFQTEVQKRSAS